MLLLGEAVAVDGRTIGRPQAFDQLEPADRLALPDPVLVGQVLHQVEVAPPEGFLLAPMPAQKLGEQPARMLLRRSIGGLIRDTLAQPGGNLGNGAQLR